MLIEVCKKLNDTNLTVNLMKSDFVKASVDYLGFKVGQGKVHETTKCQSEKYHGFSFSNKQEVVEIFWDAWVL